MLIAPLPCSDARAALLRRISPWHCPSTETCTRASATDTRGPSSGPLNTRLSRRRFLYGTGAAVALAGVVAWIRRFRIAPGLPQSDTAALTPVVVFLSVLFGHELSDADRSELSDRLAFAVRATPTLG